MLPALAAYPRTTTKRIVIYSGCVAISFLAAVILVFHGGLQAPKKIPAKRALSTVPAQIQPRFVASYGKLPLSFEVNQGQSDPQVKFLSRGRGYALFLSEGEAVLALRKPSAVSAQLSANWASGSEGRNPMARIGRLSALAGQFRRTTDSGPRTSSLIQNPKSRIENQFVRLRLVGANPNAEVLGSDELPGRANYFIGNDPKKWRTNIPTYAKVRYHNVYPGVDLEYYGNQGGQLEYDFIVAPGADPSAIALHVGAGLVPARGRPQGSPLRIDRDGSLVIAAEGGDVRFNKLVIYQQEKSGVKSQESGEKDEIGKLKISHERSGASNRRSTIGNRQSRDGRFLLDAQNRIHFALGPYDHTKTLVIDPVLSYSTYLGGSGGDWGKGIAVDSSGNAYVTGAASSTDFPTVNPLQASNNVPLGQGTVFVAKLNPAGSALAYSTYLGGSWGDAGNAIAVDSSGNAYVTGQTESTDFPTVNAFQTSNISSLFGSGTGFVAKLSATGSALAYSTYLGGCNADAGRAIAVDSAGNAYVAGETSSLDFPVTPGVFQSTGPADSCNGLLQVVGAFVTELNATGSALVYSTFLGEIGLEGANFNAGIGIALDSSGNAYVTGTTSSTNFPTASALQATLNGPSNAFVAELNASGSALVYSTFLGGSGSDGATAIAVDSSGSAYVTGYTGSTNFPTVNPLQATLNGSSNAFVAELNASGSALVYSTFLGGTGSDQGTAIAVDSSGSAYVTGYTGSTNFPTVNPFQATNKAVAAGNPTAFVAKLNPGGNALVYSTYLGGSGGDWGNGIAVGSSGNAYITGNTLSGDFPTVNPVQTTNKDTQQSLPTAFVAELSPGPAPALSFSANTLSFGGVLENATSPQGSVTVTNLGNAPLSISGITAGADFALITTAASCPYGGGTVTPGATCTIDVTFTPTALGLSAGAVTVMDNASGSPHTVQLTGTGSLPAANVSPTSLSWMFGNGTAPQAVTLTNTASVALTVRNVTISSAPQFPWLSPLPWTQSNNCLPSVGPNASCTINVSFQPTYNGGYSGTLTLTDDAINSPQTVILSYMSPGHGPAPTLSPTSLIFGNQPVGSQSAPQTITLVNPDDGGNQLPGGIGSTGPFQWRTACNSNMVQTTNSPCPTTVAFVPSGAGTQTGTLMFAYPSFPGGLTLTASLTGTGVAPEAGVSPTTLTFAGQPLGSASSPQAVTLSNTGNAPLTISSLNVSGDFSQANTCGGSVSANGSCTINVTFTPTAAGARTGTLTISDNSNNNVPVEGTQTVSLIATGLGPIASLSASSLTFASQLVGTASAPQTLTLTNAGYGTLTPLKITRAGDFAQTNNCGSSLAPAASCNIRVTFSPDNAGSLSGTLTLTDNASNSPQTVQLSGTGMDFAVTSSTPSQTVSPGQVANYSLTLAPEGGFSQMVNLTCSGAPSLATCTLTPNSATLNGTASATVAVAVSTTAPSLAPPQGRFLPPGFTGLGRTFWLFTLLELASLAALAGARRRRAACLLGACLLIVMLWSACGGGQAVSTPTPGTPAGTYTVAVTATDATTSTDTHTIQLTLTVN